MGKRIILDDDFSANAIDTVAPQVPPFEFQKSDLSFGEGYIVTSGSEIGTIKQLANWFHSESVNCSGYNKLSIYSGGGHVGLFFDANNQPLKGVRASDTDIEDCIVIPTNYTVPGGTTRLHKDSWVKIDIPQGAKTIVFNWSDSTQYQPLTFKWILSKE